MKRFIGIDPALSNSAYVVMNEEFKILSKKVITTHSASENVYINSEQRILDIFDKFKFIPLVNELEAVYIEDIGYMSKDRFLFERVGLIFLIRCFLFESNIKVKIISPKSLKKRITGNGNADKDQMIKSIANQFNIVFTNDHLADAYGLAVLALWEHQGKIKI